MHAPLLAEERAAISVTPAPGILGCPEPGPNPGSGTDDEFAWFYDCAIAVFGSKETGHLLHLATGWPRTSCYAFVARHPAQRRKPSPGFLRVLFHSDHGEPFHAAFMDGCKARWWREQQRASRIADAISNIDRMP